LVLISADCGHFESPKTYDYQIKSLIEFFWSWVSTMARNG